jgi:ribosomal-protein-serine acetyltransferase
MTADEMRPAIPERVLTDRLELRAYTESDAPAIIEAIEESRRELTEWMIWAPRMRTIDDARSFIRQTVELRADGADFSFGIFLRESGRYLGGTGFHRPNWVGPAIEIGYWMRTSEVGKGYVREAVTGLTRLGFGELGMKRMVITCASTNTRSRRVAEAVGYQLEGKLRNADRLPNGELRDTLVFSLIDTDDATRRILAGDAAR